MRPEFTKRSEDIVSHLARSPLDGSAAKQRLQIHTQVVGQPFEATYDQRPFKNKSSYYDKDDVNRSSVVF